LILEDESFGVWAKGGKDVRVWKGKKGYMEDVIKGDTFQLNIFYSQFVFYPMCFVLSFSKKLIFIYFV
jgi:hypothetical protein